jgi:hypothetical protein
VVGLALVDGLFLHPKAACRWACLIGIIPLATGVTGSCGQYSVQGLGTCPMRT